MSDEIETLPVIKAERFDETEASKLKPYLQKKCKKNFMQRNKKYLVLIIIFLVLSIPIIGSLMDMFTKSWLITLVVKLVIFLGALFFILKFGE